MVVDIQALEDDRHDPEALHCEGYQDSLSAAAAHECRRSASRGQERKRPGDDETRRGKATAHTLNHVLLMSEQTFTIPCLFGSFSIAEVCICKITYYLVVEGIHIEGCMW